MAATRTVRTVAITVIIREFLMPVTMFVVVNSVRMLVSSWLPGSIRPLVISTEALVAPITIHRNGKMDRKDAILRNTYFPTFLIMLITSRHFKLDCRENDDHQENRIGDRGCVSEIGRVFKAEIVDVL